MEKSDGQPDAYETIRARVTAALGEHGLTLHDLHDEKRADRLALRLTIVGPVLEGLEREGLQFDSLDVLESLEPDKPEGEGGIGVREPRRPLPPSDIGGIALKPPEQFAA